MRVCSICGERNEDWMEICQRCGNSIVNATMVEKKEERKVEPVFNNTNYNHNNTSNKQKESKPIENMDLKLVLIVLLVILVCLIFYTIHIFG